MQHLITFQTFSTKEDAEDVAARLQQHNIPSTIIAAAQQLDEVFTGKSSANQYELKIPPECFVEATTILYQRAAVDINEIDPAHPLLEMSNDELQQIISRPVDWGPDNYNIAGALLQSRGIAIEEGTVQKQLEEKTQQLQQKKRFDPYLLILAYACAVMPVVLNAFKGYIEQTGNFIWYFPGFIGIIFGLVILQSRTTLPDGRRIPTYDNTSVKHGLYITVLNILSWVANTLLLFLFA